MSNLSVFRFETQEVRFVGTAEDLWWVASDICAILHHSNPSMAIARLDDDEKKLLDPKQYLGSTSNQDFWAINESGMYSLVLSSRKPEAKRFKKWITSEVLPSIRKTGAYNTQEKCPPNIHQLSEAIDLVFGSIDIDKRLVAGLKANAIASQYPQLRSAMEESKKLLAIPIEDKFVYPTELTEIYAKQTGAAKISAQAMNKLLAQRGLQIKNESGKNPSWLLTDEGKQYGQLVFETARGRDKTIQAIKWNPSVLEII